VNVENGSGSSDVDGERRSRRVAAARLEERRSDGSNTLRSAVDDDAGGGGCGSGEGDVGDVPMKETVKGPRAVE
jgi:hypothetical protein